MGINSRSASGSRRCSLIEPKIARGVPKQELKAEHPRLGLAPYFSIARDAHSFAPPGNTAYSRKGKSNWSVSMRKCQGSIAWALGVLLLLGACANTADVPTGAVVEALPPSAPEVITSA